MTGTPGRSPTCDGGTFAFLVTAPVIYSLTLPIALLDKWASVYQAVCFRV
jgi:hypothetical protein